MKRQKNLSEVISLGVSFHTLPRDDKENPEDSIRDCCIAPPGYKFITADFKAMELRVLAHVSKDENMIKMFKSKIDPHKYTASLVYEINANQVTAEQRQIAKSGSFLIVYGGKAWKLSKTCNITLATAESVIGKLKEVYPKVFSWMDEVRIRIYEEHKCATIFNRVRNLPDILSHVQQVKDKCIRQGVNFLIQSPASDITAYCVVDIANELSLRKLDAYIIGTVHDSIEAIASDSDLEETLQIIKNKMENYPLLKSLGYNFDVPLETEIFIGNSFSGETEVKFNERGSVLQG